MKVRCVLFMLCATLGLSAAAPAADDSIRGAFGIWFGERLDMEGRVLVYKGENGERAYTVKDPPQAYGAFSRYTVYVTEEERVFEIVGDGRMESRDACIDELVFMTETVSAKYPGAARLASEGPLIRRTMLRQGDHLVEIACLDEYLAIRYRDDEVLRQAMHSGRDAPEGRQLSGSRERNTSGL